MDIVRILIDFYTEDPDAWAGFLKTTHPLEAGSSFVSLLEEQADEFPPLKDSMGLMGLLSDILQLENFTNEELIELGKAILDQ